jgi:predicted nucleic-acid-binding protein
LTIFCVSAISVVLETVWVLRFAYGFDRKAILLGLKNLFGLVQVAIEDSEVIAAALDSYESGLDFADALHLHSSAQADVFTTFDRSFGQRHRGSPISVTRL